MAELLTAQDTSVAPSIMENSITMRLCSKPLTLPRSRVIRSAPYSSRYLFFGWGIDFGNLPKAIGFGIVRARDESSADFGGIPAGYDPETNRFFCFDVAWREDLHGTLPFDVNDGANFQLLGRARMSFSRHRRAGRSPQVRLLSDRDAASRRWRGRPH